MLTHDEVVWGYRYLLGRDPESLEAIAGHCQRLARPILSSAVTWTGMDFEFIAGR